MPRRSLLDRMATRAALPGMGAGIGNTLPATSGQSRSAGGVRVGSATVQYSSPGQPMQLDWDALTSVDQAYLASLYVMRCVRCIANDIAGLDIRWGIDPRHPGNFNPLAAGAQLLGPALPGGRSGKPNQTTSTRALLAWSLVQYLVTGRFGWEYQRDVGQGATPAYDDPKQGAVVGLWPLVSAYLDAVPAERKTYWWDGFIYHLPTGDVALPADQVFYAWRPGPKDWRQPESYIAAAQVPIRVQVGIERYMLGLIRNNMVATTMVISPPFEEAGMRRAWQEQFLQEFTGVDNAGGTVFAEFEPGEGRTTPGGGTEYVQVERIAQSALDAQLLEMNRDVKDDICIAMGVPRSRVGDASRRTFTNAGQEYKNYWEGTLLTVVAELQDYINTDLAPRLGPEVCWADLSRVESLRRTTIFAPPAIKDALDEGLVSIPQAQDILGIDTYDDSDDVDTALEGGADFGSSPGVKVGGRGLLVQQHRGPFNTTTYGQPAQHTRAAAAPPAAPSKTDLADKVHGYLARTYPAGTIGWVHDADWSGPKRVPLDQVQMDRRPGGRDQEKVQGIADAIAAGKPMDPVVLVDAPGADRLKVADGYHRTLAHRRAGKGSVLAYVGKVDDPAGPWDREMHDKKLNRALAQLAPVVAQRTRRLAVAAAGPEAGSQLVRALAGQQTRYDVAPLGEGKNWVTEAGGLPLFIRAIAHALIRSGHPEQQAIQVAVGTVRRWAGGGGKVTAKTRAKAAAALADWEAKKAKAHATRADGVMGEGGTAGLLLPVGRPRPPQPRQATLEGPPAPHAFTGTNPAACARCGRPAADPVHHGRARRTAPQRAAQPPEQGSRHRGPDGHQPVPTGHQQPAASKGAKRRAKAALVGAIEGDRTGLEAPAEDRLRQVFGRMADATVSRLEGKRGKRMLRDQQTRAEGEPPPPADLGQPPPPVDAAAIFDTAFWQQQVLAALQPLYQGAAQLGVGQVARQAALGDGWTPESTDADAVARVLAARANRIAGDVTETTYRELAASLGEGVQAGEPIGTLANRVRDVLDRASRVRARTIARTEVVSSMAQAADEYANRLPAGLLAGKRWLAHHDGRTRPTHREADGQTVPVGQPFDVGGFPMQHPGDPTAPAEEVVNCRCGVAYLPAKEAAA